MTHSSTTAGDRTAVTVVGLGPMGVALAEAFLRKGHPTTVWNRSPEKADALVGKGAVRAATIAAAVTASPLTVVCLKDYDAMYAALAPAGGALSGRVVLNHGSGTPAQAREAVTWAKRNGAHYLDGAVMVPPYAVGLPDSVFLYSGPRTVFDAHEKTLASLGGSRYLGADPGLAVLYNTALLGMMYTSLQGFLHALALVGSADVKLTEFAGLAVDWFLSDVVNPALLPAVPGIEKGVYPGDHGTMEMNLTALEHIVHTSREQGVDTEVPGQIMRLAQKAIAAGHGGDNFMAVIELLKKRAEQAE
ncbi:NAD(P)-binding domain-containing protein [Streptomyces sp. NPDC003077]|uniref:NAD(P)-dependent oxidoreductase n=1 Tax=Streptomyces sp. NPDC003077 TaxID=3154443 RepID=UPI0033AFF7B5